MMFPNSIRSPIFHTSSHDSPPKGAHQETQFYTSLISLSQIMVLGQAALRRYWQIELKTTYYLSITIGLHEIKMQINPFSNKFSASQGESYIILIAFRIFQRVFKMAITY